MIDVIEYRLWGAVYGLQDPLTNFYWIQKVSIPIYFIHGTIWCIKNILTLTISLYIIQKFCPKNFIVGYNKAQIGRKRGLKLQIGKPFLHLKRLLNILFIFLAQQLVYMTFLRTFILPLQL